MYRIEMLPAEYGDCLWITWGTEADRHHMLIDGGPPGTGATLRRFLECQPNNAGDRLHIDLLVVSHVDSDHIGGIINLLKKLPSRVSISDIWYNGYHHLSHASVLGGKQGETVSKELTKKRIPWNSAFEGKAVAISNDHALVEKALPGGMVLTLLSPTFEKLAELAPDWKAQAIKAKLIPGEHFPADHPSTLGDREKWPSRFEDVPDPKFEKDSAPANGSSIAFIATYSDRSCLFAADAHADVLTASLQRLGTPVKLNAFKLPHHGSAANLSPELLDCVQCDRFLISSNGKRYGHPDDEAIFRVLKRKKSSETELIFNYRSDTTSNWAKLPNLPGAPAAKIVFPPDGTAGVTVDL